MVVPGARRRRGMRCPTGLHRGPTPLNILTIQSRRQGVVSIRYGLDPEEAQSSSYSLYRGQVGTSPDCTPGGNYIPPARPPGVTPGVVRASEKPGSRTSLLRFNKNVRLMELRWTLHLRSDGLIESTTAGLSFTPGVI